MRKEKSFTLIEILVVITIIGILASIIVVGTKAARDKAKRTVILQFSAQVHHAVGAYAVGIWDFENNLNDSSGYNNNGTWEDTGNPDPEAGKIKCAIDNKENTPSGQGCSLEFNGSDDYVYLPSVNPTQAITVAAWIKSSTFNYTGYYQIVSKYSAFILSASNQSASFLVYYPSPLPSGWQYGSQVVVTDRQNWHYLVGTYNSSTGKLKLYIDGVLKADDQFTAGKLIQADTGPINIGRREGGTAVYFTGFIDEVRIYSEALSSAQVQKLYVEGARKHGLLAED